MNFGCNASFVDVFRGGSNGIHGRHGIGSCQSVNHYVPKRRNVHFQRHCGIRSILAIANIDQVHNSLGGAMKSAANINIKWRGSLTCPAHKGLAVSTSTWHVCTRGMHSCIVIKSRASCQNRITLTVKYSGWRMYMRAHGSCSGGSGMSNTELYVSAKKFSKPVMSLAKGLCGHFRKHRRNPNQNHVWQRATHCQCIDTSQHRLRNESCVSHL